MAARMTAKNCDPTRPDLTRGMDEADASLFGVDYCQYST